MFWPGGAAGKRAAAAGTVKAVEKAAGSGTINKYGKHTDPAGRLGPVCFFGERNLLLTGWGNGGITFLPTWLIGIIPEQPVEKQSKERNGVT